MALFNLGLVGLRPGIASSDMGWCYPQPLQAAGFAAEAGALWRRSGEDPAGCHVLLQPRLWQRHVFLVARFGGFGNGSIGAKLEQAFVEFEAWCRDNKKSSSLKFFDLKTFKVTSQLCCECTANICHT